MSLIVEFSLVCAECGLELFFFKTGVFGVVDDRGVPAYYEDFLGHGFCLLIPSDQLSKHALLKFRWSANVSLHVNESII
ncbi:MAG: hypothetical protein ACJAUW_002102 [Yoonia sp.]|jgi:hypothetical protein